MCLKQKRPLTTNNKKDFEQATKKMNNGKKKKLFKKKKKYKGIRQDFKSKKQDSSITKKKQRL